MVSDGKGEGAKKTERMGGGGGGGCDFPHTYDTVIVCLFLLFVGNSVETVPNLISALSF